MGKYINSINGLSLGSDFISKRKNLVSSGATITSGSRFQKDLVCLVDNGLFAACGYAFDEEEFEVFKKEDGRTKQWFILPDAEKHVD